MVDTDCRLVEAFFYGTQMPQMPRILIDLWRCIVGFVGYCIEMRSNEIGVANHGRYRLQINGSGFLWHADAADYADLYQCCLLHFFFTLSVRYACVRAVLERILGADSKLGGFVEEVRENIGGCAICLAVLTGIQRIGDDHCMAFAALSYAISILYPYYIHTISILQPYYNPKGDPS